MLDEFTIQTLKSNKKFTDFTPEERSIMILSNHPVWRAYKEIEQEVKDECDALESMTEIEREEYFSDMEKVDGEWEV